MRSDVDTATADALAAAPDSGIVPRQFVWITAKDRTTGDAVSMGFWNGLDSVTLNVIDGQTGNEVSRTYIGGGTLLSIGSIPLAIGLDVRSFSVVLSQINPDVADAVRDNDPRLAPIEIHRGLLDTTSRLLIAAPRLHSRGKVDTVQFQTPKPGSEGGITLSCTSISSELTRVNPAKRSDEHSKLRSGDRFYRYAGVAGSWNFWWGEQRTS
jgi:hypothetical protein